MSENYARALCKVVIGQITRGFGFAAIHQSALDAMTDIMRLYIEEIGTRAHEYSELASRTDSNFHDVHQAFQDMSIDMNDLYQYLIHADEIPFAKTIPPFPLTESQIAESQATAGGNGTKESTDETTTTTTTTTTTSNTVELPAHIPSFLPDFPDRHTFSKTPLQLTLVSWRFFNIVASLYDSVGVCSEYKLHKDVEDFGQIERYRRTFTVQDLVQRLLNPYCCLKRLRNLTIYDVEDAKDIELLRVHQSLFFQHLEHLEWYVDYLTLSFLNEMVVDHPNNTVLQSVRSIQLYLDRKDDPSLGHCLQILQLESLSINYGARDDYDIYPELNTTTDIDSLLPSSLSLRELDLSNFSVPAVLGQTLTSLALGNDNGLRSEHCHLLDPAALFQSLQAIESLSHLSLFLSNTAQDYQPSFFDYLAKNNTLTSLSLAFIESRSYLTLIANKTNIKRLQIEMDDDIVFPHVRSLRLSATKDRHIYHQLCTIKRQHANGHLGLQHLHLGFNQSHTLLHAGHMIYNLPSFCQSLVSTLKWLTIQSSFMEIHQGLLSGFARISHGLEVLEIVSIEDFFGTSFLQSASHSKRILDQIQLTPSSSIKQFILKCSQTLTTIQSCYIPRTSSHGLYLTSSSMTPTWITLKYAFDECQVPLATTNNTLPTNDNLNQYWNGDQKFDDNDLNPIASDLNEQQIG
eukprot:gene11637-13587_t